MITFFQTTPRFASLATYYRAIFLVAVVEIGETGFSRGRQCYFALLPHALNEFCLGIGYGGLSEKLTSVLNGWLQLSCNQVE